MDFFSNFWTENANAFCFNSCCLCQLLASNLQGALNPDAEEAVTERFKISKARLRAELGDQLQSRFERLDETHESLEYIREKAELCANEAKVGC